MILWTNVNVNGFGREGDFAKLDGLEPNEWAMLGWDNESANIEGDLMN